MNKDEKPQPSMYVEKLTEWHTKFNVPIRSFPSFPSEDRINLRLSLIDEEYLDELKQHIKERDIVKVADDLGDILYVVFGCCLEFGIPIDAVFNEIHRSNLTKVWPDGTIHQREDGKILKPDTFEPPEIGKVLFNEIVQKLAEKFSMNEFHKESQSKVSYHDFIKLFDGETISIPIVYEENKNES